MRNTSNCVLNVTGKYNDATVSRHRRQIKVTCAIQICATLGIIVGRYCWLLLGPFHGAIAVPSVSVVVVVVVVDIARRLRYSYSWRATSDTW